VEQKWKGTTISKREWKKGKFSFPLSSSGLPTRVERVL